MFIDINTLTKEERRLYDKDELFRVLFSIVSRYIDRGGKNIVASKIKDMAKGARDKDTVIKIASDFYTTLKIAESKDRDTGMMVPKLWKYYGGKNYSGFVFKVLKHILLNDVARSKTRKKYCVSEGDAFEYELKDIENKAFNKRPTDKQCGCLLDSVEEIAYDRSTKTDSLVSNKEIVDYYKEYFGDEIIDLLLEGHSIKESIRQSTGITDTKEVEYARNKFGRSRRGFIQFMKDRGIEIKIGEER